MLAETRTEDVGSGIACPKEYEYRQGIPIVVGDACWSSDEAKSVEGCEWQSYVELCHKCHSPVGDAVGAVKIEFGYQQIHYRYKVGDENLSPHNVGVEHPNSNKQIGSRSRSDEAVDLQVHLAVGNSSELPYRKCCNSCEEYEKRVWAQYDAGYEYGNKDYARDGTND